MNKGVFGIPVKTKNSLKFVGCWNGLEVFQFCDELFSTSWKLSIEKKMLKRTLDNLNKIDFYSQQKIIQREVIVPFVIVFLDEVKKKCGIKFPTRKICFQFEKHRLGCW